MKTFYNIATHIAYAHIQVAQFFSKKLRLFVQGRTRSFPDLSSKIAENDKTIWVHCASLGEFEQGVPIMQELRGKFPSHKIVVTFFSPSGYEVKKNTPLADATAYLPFDTKKNAAKFLDIVQPTMALFIKYEIWPNYLLALKSRSIPTYLVSALFREKQIFFKPFGNFMRKSLASFNHFFVQDQTSKELLNNIGFYNVTISGDTRFDRVSHQIEQENRLDAIEKFKDNKLTLVCGSTWPEDDDALIPFINSKEGNIKCIIAPHKIDKHKIEVLQKKLALPSVLYSEIEQHDLASFAILIIDNIGLLTKIYSYAEIAYVGGAMGSTGLHNILEPATFGIPIVIGNHFENFPEAKRLQQLAGLFSVSDSEQCADILEKLSADHAFRKSTGMICGHFINSNTGATQNIIEHITSNGDSLI